MAFNMFPFSNFHELNLDWVLKVIKECKAAVETALEGVETALSNAVLYISQSKDTSSRRVACTNIHAVSYDSTVISQADQAQARNNIGAAAASAIPDVSDVLRYSSQSLTSDQQAQARTNIGAVASSAIPDVSDVLRYSSQSLNSTQKAQARTNIGAVSADTPNFYGGIQLVDGTTSSDPSIDLTPECENNTNELTLQGSYGTGAVLVSGIANPVYNNQAANKTYVDSAVSDVVRTSAQTLSTEQKAQARTNIGAISAAEIPPAASAVLYTSQSLTTGQQQQARSNISAMAADNTEFNDNVTIIGSTQEVSDERATLDLTNVEGESTSTHFRLIHEKRSSDNILKIQFEDTAGSTSTDKVLTGLANPTESHDAANKAYVDAQQPVTVLDTSSTTPTITNAQNNHIYLFSEDLTSLSLTTGMGAYMIGFHSGSTPTTTSFPVSILGLDDFVPEADTYYEINVFNGRAVWMGWADPVEEGD